ncbi:hypothetical protein PHYPSEUDO_008576 [Phytophthora pseudosyringae]|uniref:Uncharacterized protein n=1 Tax=Phytophthora pseudosyringae TaxID=221518 RepID=A0A8T1VDU8_9STRA|nr:hypothetical protein PHYPSEUDO_008576 [Phytophthora pseudosyringae]
MDLSNVPFDVPVILQSVRKGTNLQNPVGSNIARCLVDNRDVYEQMTLRRVEDNKVTIESVHNGHLLSVRGYAGCVIESKGPTKAELFTMETDNSGTLYLVSSLTNKVLQIVEPRVTAAINRELPAQDQHRALVGKERESFILELVKYGKSADEIEQIVTRLFDAPAVSTSTSASAFAVPIGKEQL